jgi:hypothetical protein
MNAILQAEAYSNLIATARRHERVIRDIFNPLDMYAILLPNLPNCSAILENW